MRVAMIAPTPLLDLTHNLDYHMVLPGPALKSGLYRDFYMHHSGFKILDNGEAENDQISNAGLLDLAHKLRIDEVVVPDVMTDFEATVIRAKEFGTYRYSPDFQYMGVIQGKTHQEFTQCLYEFQRLGFIHTIGVPRLMNRVLGSFWARAAFIETMAEQFPELEFHALGASTWIKEAAVLGDLRCRGIDTSLPFVLGLANIDIRKGPYVDRQDNYFYYEAEPTTRELILNNVAEYRNWSGDYKEETPIGVL